MLKGDPDRGRDVDEIVKSAALRVEAQRVRRAVLDAELRLQSELHASCRAEAAARDALRLPPKPYRGADD